MAEELKLYSAEELSRLDSQSPYFVRELNYVIPERFNVIYPKYSANKLIPVSRRVPEGATTYSYRIMDRLGQAKIINNEADDLPNINVLGNEYLSKIIGIGSEFTITMQEQMSDQMTGRSTLEEKVKASIEAHLYKMGAVALFGDSAYNVTGWFNQPNITTMQVANNAAGNSTLWANKTPDEIYKDLVNGFIRIVQTNSAGAFVPDTLAMSTASYEIANSTFRSTYSSITVLDAFLDSHPQIKEVIAAPELVNQFTGGSNGFVFYINDEEYFRQEIPLFARMFEPERRSLAYKYQMLSKHGGTCVIYPLSQLFCYGI